jgi:hypothetical protein
MLIPSLVYVIPRKLLTPVPTPIPLPELPGQSSTYDYRIISERAHHASDLS